jgi:steroid 5-alpha reductase family enzyme
MNPPILVALGINLAMILMFFVWMISKRLNNAGYVDVAWSYMFVPVVWLFVALGPGDPVRSLTIAALVTFWSLRLGTYLLLRVSRHHPNEDPRYVSLREQFPKRPWLMFFGFFEAQAILVGILAAPFAVAAANPAPALAPIEIAAIALWVLSISGEAIADAQLAAFRKDPANRGRVCDVGLWRFSRHPNYFFEWMIWVSYYVFALGSPWGWATVFAPILMLVFLTRISGIPPAEAQSLKSRGDAYRAYQRRTSAFIPWFPKAS